MDIERVYTTLIDIESRIDVNQWTVGGVRIWPLLRNDLWMDLLSTENFAYQPGAAPQLAAPEPSEPGHGTWAEFLKLTRAAYRLPQGLQGADVLGWSRRQDYGEWFRDGRADRMIDPMLADARERGLSTQKLLPAARAGDEELVCVHPGIAVDLDACAAAVAGIKLAGTAAPLFDYLQRVLPDLKLNHSSVFSRVRRLLGRAAVFKLLLERVQPRVVYFAVFYAQEAAALCHACRISDVPSVDVQHGKQGLHHAMYGGWTQLPSEGYTTLPDFCWLWGSDQAVRIATTNARPSRSLNPVIGGNRWLARWVAGKHPPLAGEDAAAFGVSMQEASALGQFVILISLQPLKQLLPPFILLSMRAAPRHWRWLLRLHPHSRSRREELESQLRALGLDNFDVVGATAAPLYALLSRVDVHLTCWSTVGYEALAFGVPTVIVHDTGRTLYAKDISDGLFLSASSAEETLSVIRAAERGGVPSGLSRYIVTDDTHMVEALVTVMGGRGRWLRWRLRRFSRRVFSLARRGVSVQSPREG